MGFLLNPYAFAAEFTPASLFAGSETGLWLAASDIATLFQASNGTTAVAANDDPVGYWGDKSGNGNHCIQATAGLRPLYQAAIPSVKFDGTDDRLALATRLTATDGSLLALFKTGAAAFSAGAQVLISCADTAAADNWFEVGVNTQGRIYVESNVAGTKHTLVGSTFLDISTAYTLVIVNDGAELYVEVSGTEQNPIVAESVGTLAWFGSNAAADNTVIGGTVTSAGLVRPWKGEISEVIVTSKDITA